MTSRIKTVLVIGGGVSGISAAWRLNQRGWDVTLVERRSVLGGRLTSHQQPSLPTPFDNGPHLLLDAYSATLKLFRELAIDDCFEFPWPLEVPFAFADGKLSRLRSWPLPSPLNFAAGLMTFKPLWLDARFRTAKTIFELISRPVDRQCSVQIWLESRADYQEMKLFWKPLVSATMNSSMEDVSISSLQEVFRSGFCSPWRGGRLGYCRYPFRSVFHDRILHRLESAGIDVLLNESVTGAELHSDLVKWISFQQGGKSHFDQVVVALQPVHLRRFVDSFPAGRMLIDTYRLTEWTETPISNLYLWADQRPIIDAVTCTPDGPFDWVFDYGRIWGDHQAPLCLMFGKRTLVDLKNSDVSRDDVLEKLAETFPTLRFVDWTASRFSQEVRAIPVKPRSLWGKTLSQHTPIRNLHLTGDWLDPDLPPTIEAGVRSGERLRLRKEKSRN